MNWQRVVFLLFLSALLVGFGYLFYRKTGQFLDIKKSQRRYQAEINAGEDRLVHLIKETEELENNPDELVRWAREKLGLVKKNEKVFIFIPTPPPEGKSSPADGRAGK